MKKKILLFVLIIVAAGTSLYFFDVYNFKDSEELVQKDTLIIEKKENILYGLNENASIKLAFS